ncbi:tripartite tricarboxylate transporter substrate binding protein [Pseudorhodoplanes sp.]|uniref:Bug family tripartite tricarboxylate transporter substrate binding protein n=1 Tax=Pseudorhodoplanes sp. TaxID=1934341 RepID=UPI002B5D53E5|nr:tripartite tricarboxylate transporter substrate binding protein [Pseudorhodoplanes sp.]HWV55230.1 tripartite tricarboxylate transporter substrate binding protein [Pseudorhodoplanes sp.]
MSVMSARCIIAASLLAFTAPAIAQDSYPSRPVRIIVGFGAGASADSAARIVAQKLGQLLGQQFIVENKPGAGSNIATEFVSQAPKDGYTLLMGTVANTINTTLAPQTRFDFARDFAPIAPLVVLPNILVVHPDTGVKSVAELIALAKSKPDGLSFASSGVGTSPHLSGELFNQMAGVKIVHVPYPGSGQAVSDLLANRVQVMFSPAATVLQHVEKGSLRALASSQLKRTKAAPQLPTMDEAALKGFDTGLWFGLLAPTGTPKDVIDKLSKATNEALKSPDVVETLSKQGMDILGGTPDEFGKLIAVETDKWAKVVKASGLQKTN